MVAVTKSLKLKEIYTNTHKDEPSSTDLDKSLYKGVDRLEQKGPNVIGNNKCAFGLNSGQASLSFPRAERTAER